MRHIVACADNSLTAVILGRYVEVSIRQSIAKTTCSRQRSTVIYLLSTIRRNRQRSWRYVQFAIHIGNVIKISDVLTCSVFDHCIRRYIVACADKRLASVHIDGLHVIAFHQTFSFIRIFLQRRAVIYFLITIRRDDQRIFPRHRQCSFLVCDVIAISNIFAVFVFDDCIRRNVITCSDFRLASGHRNTLDVIAVCQIGICITVLRKRVAIVLFRIAVCSNRQRLRSYLQSTVFVFDIIVCRNIFIRTVLDDCSRRNVVGSSGQRLTSGHRNAHNGIAGYQIITMRVTVLRKRIAVILF